MTTTNFLSWTYGQEIIFTFFILPCLLRHTQMRSRTPTPLLSPNGKPQKSVSEYNWSDAGTVAKVRNVSTIGAIKRAAKKVVGVFAFIFTGQKKLKPGECRSDPGDCSNLDRESTCKHM